MYIHDAIESTGMRMKELTICEDTAVLPRKASSAQELLEASGLHMVSLGQIIEKW